MGKTLVESSGTRHRRRDQVRVTVTVNDAEAHAELVNEPVDTALREYLE